MENLEKNIWITILRIFTIFFGIIFICGGAEEMVEKEQFVKLIVIAVLITASVMYCFFIHKD